MFIANRLLSIDEDQRIKLLKKWSKKRKHNDQVIILCKMLFTARKDSTFRRPRIGAPVFIADQFARNSLEPIILENEIPLIVVQGYFGGGLPETAGKYLEYCIKNCDWSKNQYKKSGRKRLEDVVDRFLEKNKLTDERVAKFFKNQVKRREP